MRALERPMADVSIRLLHGLSVPSGMETVRALSERRRHGLHMHHGDRSVLGGQIVTLRSFLARHRVFLGPNDPDSC